jgi:hypothetical protein
VPEAGAAEVDRELVADQLAATVGEDRRHTVRALHLHLVKEFDFVMWHTHASG